MTQSPPPDLAGTIVADRFRVERLIGQGGMGSVWAARHVSLDQMVAIKFIHPKLIGSREALRRFDNEAKAAADRKSTRLNSSHVKISYAVFCLKKKKVISDYLGLQLITPTNKTN